MYDKIPFPQVVLPAYDEPHRRYHNFEHIYNGLNAIHFLTENRVMGHGEMDDIITAWWLHDLVYNPKAAPGSNEAESAGIAAYLGANDRVIDLIRHTIYPFTEPVHPKSPAAVIMDADLAGFAAPWIVYERHTRLLREEYSHLTDEEWDRGRAAFMNKLLNEQTPFYKTEKAQKLWTHRAARNILRDLGQIAQNNASR